MIHASELLRTKRFQAIYLVTQNKKNISALSLTCHLRVAYATAWRVKHELFEAMLQRESRQLLEGVRHTTAVFRLRTGVDINTIPAWLRYAALSTS